MDTLELTTERVEDAHGPGDDPYIAVRALVNCATYTDPDYIMNVDNFFDSLTQDEAVISFLGGCLVEGCCSNGAWTTFSPSQWIWNHNLSTPTLLFPWPEVIAQGENLITIIETGTDAQLLWFEKNPQPQHYRQCLDRLKKRLNIE